MHLVTLISFYTQGTPKVTHLIITLVGHSLIYHMLVVEVWLYKNELIVNTVVPVGRTFSAL